VAIAATLLLVPAYAQQSRWSSADDKTAKCIIEMERNWADSVCVDNGVVARLLAEDFQGTSTGGARFIKADELKDEKGACALRAEGRGSNPFRPDHPFQWLTINFRSTVQSDVGDFVAARTSWINADNESGNSHVLTETALVSGWVAKSDPETCNGAGAKHAECYTAFCICQTSTSARKRTARW
jgi:hypothetical protein